MGEIDIQALSSEDILVCVSDNPYRVGWLALYLVVRGIVVTKRSGAGLHHALQLAREVGVPYVELAPGEAERIPAGAEIRIDGTTGSIGIVGSAG